MDESRSACCMESRCVYACFSSLDAHCWHAPPLQRVGAYRIYYSIAVLNMLRVSPACHVIGAPGALGDLQLTHSNPLRELPPSLIATLLYLMYCLQR